MNLILIQSINYRKGIYKDIETLYKIYGDKYDLQKNKQPSIFSSSNREFLDYNIPLFLKLNNKTCQYIKWFIGKNNKTIIKLKCECGKEFDYPIYYFMNSEKNKKSFKCEQCTLEQRGLKHRKTKEIKYNIELMGYKVLTPKEDIKAREKILIENKEGYKGYVIYNNIYKKKQNISWFNYNTAKEYLEDNINIYLKNNNINSVCVKAKGSHEPMDMICECGNPYTVIRSVLIGLRAGQRCPFCTNSISNIELKVKEYLEELNIEYEQQKSFENLRDKHKLRFDFYIPNKNTLIEVLGEQHYSPAEKFGGQKTYEDRKKKDEIKELYCKDNNIKLIKIKYTLFNNDSYKSKIDKIF